MPNPYFPFHALGYQCNPFRAVTNDEWVQVAVLPESIQSVHFTHLQILGDKGHGKTTTLLALADRFRRAGRRVAYEHLEVDQDCFKTSLADLDVFVLDEAQRLNRNERVRFRHEVSLYSASVRSGEARHFVSVLGSHEDLTLLFSQFGLPLTTVRLDTIPLTQLAAVIARRLAFFALEPASTRVGISPQTIAYLHATFGADLRRIEQALYEVFEEIKEKGEVKEIGEMEVRKVVMGKPADG